ncbi:PHP domain-containing protein [Duganella sp. FT3S]|uniref:PHP domain-containing protein n=1 Tax=Rugamonas fusca TaxID=2758568 RepID=A0A7W2EKE5_9BURK|nr:PHP domain-containing protein [Rugamonas fusca]MBA5607375.1 PHP domain-containing protein [Rugamonas fusca]
MKKIDLHIHTVSTQSDVPFEFSLTAFQEYVETAKLDAVAITNHDIFDSEQFRTIKNALSIPVFPGIEINLAAGHLLLISNGTDLDGFQSKCDQVTAKIQKKTDSISFEELHAIYGDLSDYLLIPHADKNPEITGTTFEKLKPFIAAGEVASSKKFIYAIKDIQKPTPVLFSDLRIQQKLNKFTGRQTYIDCGQISFDSVKSCLQDKSKVALSAEDGNSLLPIFDDGQMISSGLNILLGERSSGKTYTLNRIRETVENPKYIAQFQLVQQNEADERDFNNEVQNSRSIFVDGYLSGLKAIVDEVINIDLHANELKLDAYVQSLLKSAADADRQDAYSKTALFSETEFVLPDLKALTELIESVRNIIENIEFRTVIEKHVELQALKELSCELILNLRERSYEQRKRKIANEIIKDVKSELRLRTSATPVDEIDLFEYCLDRAKVRKFESVVSLLKQEATISDQGIQGFRVEAKRLPFAGALEVRGASGTKLAFSDAFKKYDVPYAYLRELLKIESLTRSEIYRLFVRISYRILNRDGFEVSGGERSEFRLLQHICDAQNYDILLIDEPESSFDNLFLKSDVNAILKAISETMPVVVVTHNNTVGASIGADYILYARKESENGTPCYRLYSGRPSDKTLISADKKSLESHAVVLNSLEAGSEAYEGRRKRYETIKN